MIFLLFDLNSLGRIVGVLLAILVPVLGALWFAGAYPQAAEMVGAGLGCAVLIFSVLGTIACVLFRCDPPDYRFRLRRIPRLLISRYRRSPHGLRPRRAR